MLIASLSFQILPTDKRHAAYLEVTDRETHTSWNCMLICMRNGSAALLVTVSEFQGLQQA